MHAEKAPMATGESLYFIKWQWREKKKKQMVLGMPRDCPVSLLPTWPEDCSSLQIPVV